ncbi:MAG: hypothetical protein R3B55_02745 [Candidatus Paceibacterota bacterium]
MSRKGTRTIVNQNTGETQDFIVDMSKPKESRQKKNERVSKEMTEALGKIVEKDRERLHPKNVPYNPLNAYSDYPKN